MLRAANTRFCGLGGGSISSQTMDTNRKERSFYFYYKGLCPKHSSLQPSHQRSSQAQTLLHVGAAAAVTKGAAGRSRVCSTRWG